MKELIIQALDKAIVKCENSVPQVKKQNKTISILDVKPIGLLEFIKENNIPENCEFDGIDNGYDGWNDIVLSWMVDVPTTDKDKLDYKRRAFTNYAFREVYNLLLDNGYRRGSYCTSKLKEFDDTTTYGMYINKEFDRLVRYYSLSFVKI